MSVTGSCHYSRVNMSYISAVTTSIHKPLLRLLKALRVGSNPIMTLTGFLSFRAAQVIAQTGLDVGTVHM